MNIAEIFIGFIAAIIGGAITYLTIADQLPVSPLATFLKIPPQHIRSRSLIAGIGFVLLGLFMIVQGFGVFK